MTPRPEAQIVRVKIIDKSPSSYRCSGRGEALTLGGWRLPALWRLLVPFSCGRYSSGAWVFLLKSRRARGCSPSMKKARISPTDVNPNTMNAMASQPLLMWSYIYNRGTSVPRTKLSQNDAHLTGHNGSHWGGVSLRFKLCE